ncbi:GNAT family N-acetyltransferase [Cellulosimicrobium marinum]|uniref:GNAT family N-acetyltransferase n=1 Tax=Cellulosimicrobium marinum TaxID=1638992 RepID=UPI001E2B4A1C|nr:GNAT family N-acetyltransferase [Cellulosimicrobium marinum]MCB7135301.1 GNAT family N-acetyltransferase [Cellulosimicrobium marinum]
MTTTLRPFATADLDPLVDLSLRAWEPVFRAWRDVLGDELFALAHPSWRDAQADAVRSTCSTHAGTTLVAERDGRVVGFAAVVVGDPDARGMRAGDLEMIAVDPRAQRAGTGRLLLDASLDLMREAGCAWANVWTGGDAGHGPARAMYEAGGFTALPVVHYYRAL